MWDVRSDSQNVHQRDSKLNQKLVESKTVCQSLRTINCVCSGRRLCALRGLCETVFEQRFVRWMKINFRTSAKKKKKCFENDKIKSCLGLLTCALYNTPSWIASLSLLARHTPRARAYPFCILRFKGNIKIFLCSIIFTQIAANAQLLIKNLFFSTTLAVSLCEFSSSLCDV